MEIHFEDRAMIITDQDRSILLIADVHLGIHIDIERRSGALFPPQHHTILDRIKRLISKYDVDTTVVVGDLKHSLGADVPYNWENIPAFVERLQRASDVIIVPGNHDGDIQALLPRRTKVADVRGMIVYDGVPSVAVIHGHAWPSEEVVAARILVIGHNHPCISVVRKTKTPANYEVRRSGVTLPVVIKAYLSKDCVRKHIGVIETANDSWGTLIVLPAFNSIASGARINVPNSTLQGPIFERGCVNQQDAEIYSSNGVFLGKLAEIQHFNETVK